MASPVVRHEGCCKYDHDLPLRRRPDGPVDVGRFVGASAGYCWNCVGERPMTFMELVPTHTRGNRAALAINPNLLRLGMSF